MTMFSVGPTFVPLLLALGMDSVGWRSVLLFLGVFLCVLTALACLVLRSRPEDIGLWPDGEAAGAGDRDGDRGGPETAVINRLQLRRAAILQRYGPSRFGSQNCQGL